MNKIIVFLFIFTTVSLIAQTKSGIQFIPKKIVLEELYKPTLHETIAAIASNYLNDKNNKSLIIGISNNGKKTYYTYSNDLESKTQQKIDSSSIFEIGSITKTFTGALLAATFLKNKINLTDKVTLFLPNTLQLSKNGKEITILQLSNHTSGLAKLTNDFFSYAKYDITNPYKNIDKAYLYNVLTKNELQSIPGEKHEYSNMGVALLGCILEDINQKKYESLLQDIIFSPLKMNSSFIELPTTLTQKLVDGHDKNGKKVLHWDFKAMAPSGAIKSSANDMLIYLDAQMDCKDKKLNTLFSITHEPSITIENNKKVGLNWFIEKTKSSKEIIFHSGNTGGFSSYAAFNKEKKISVVVLLNNNVFDEVDDIGNSILNYMLDNAEK
jgi:CubicO group peptidase (beta-lactamase class C family)